MDTILGLRKFCEGFSQLNADSYNSIFDYCKRSLTKQGVFVNMERLNALNATRFVADSSKTPVTVPFRLRMVLQTKSKKASEITPISQIAHGMVLEIVEADKILQVNILAYPTPHIPNIFRVKDVAQKLMRGDYCVYEMEDGTTCNLYYDPNYVYIDGTGYKVGKWMFATRRSYDIEQYEFMGEKYSNVFQNVLAKYPNFSFDRLVRGNTYTIGFKHPAHHPLNQPADWNPNLDVNWVIRAWVIAGHDSAGNRLSDAELDIGFPQQLPVANPPTLEQMQHKCVSALRDHNVGKNRTSFFGYILRSDLPEFSQVAHVCMDSKLFTELRQNVYNVERRMSKYPDVNFKRKENIIITAHLSYEKRKIFFILFPQFQQYRNMISEIMTGVARKILDKPVKSEYLEKINAIHQKISRTISLTYKPTGNYQDDLSMVMGLISNYSYINVYYTLIFC